MSGHELAPACHRELPAEAGEARVDESSQGAVSDELQLLDLLPGHFPGHRRVGGDCLPAVGLRGGNEVQSAMHSNAVAVHGGSELDGAPLFTADSAARDTDEGFHRHRAASRRPARPPRTTRCVIILRHGHKSRTRTAGRHGSRLQPWQFRREHPPSPQGKQSLSAGSVARTIQSARVAVAAVLANMKLLYYPVRRPPPRSEPRGSRRRADSPRARTRARWASTRAT